MRDQLRLPQIGLELIEDLSPPAQSGFLRLRRVLCRAHFPDGSSSEPFVYDAVEREGIDAVVIAAHFRRAGRHHVYLRSALRPPLWLRRTGWALGPEPLSAGLWELPAGLVEPEEQSSLEGIRGCAQRELLEELGFEVRPEDLRPLGPATFPVPAMIAERHFYFAVEVDPDTRREPTLDGSPLERHAAVLPLLLDEALSLCTSGTLQDEKTELGLRRLRDSLLSGGPG